MFGKENALRDSISSRVFHYKLHNRYCTDW